MQNSPEAAGIGYDPDDDLYEDEDTQKDKYLAFELAGEGYAIEIIHVSEIIGIQDINGLPEMPDFIMGIINLRGNVVPVMDVRTRFKLQQRDYNSRTCIIVVSMADSLIGLIVDKVSEVLDIPAADIEPPPRTARRVQHRFISGIGKTAAGVKVILDVNGLLFDEEVTQLGEAVH